MKWFLCGRVAACLVAICWALVFSTGFAAEPNATANWPQFRGPHSTGVGASDQLPDRWSATENVEWKTDLPGLGWSSPIVLGNRIFVTTVVNTGETPEAKKGLYFKGEQREPPQTVHLWKVMCLDLTTGKILWEQTAHEGRPSTTLHIKNTYASETPVTDGKRVYAYFGNLGVFCYDLDGHLAWSKLLEPHATRAGWGTAASPVLFQDRLYLVNDNEESSYLLALDAATGQEIWRKSRDESSNWATPFVWQNELRTEIVTAGTNRVRSYDLAGNVLWELGGMSVITIGTPFADGGLLYVGSGYVLDLKRPLFAIRPGGSGDISVGKETGDKKSVAWHQPLVAPYNPSVLVYQGRLYILYDRGLFACLNSQTGEIIYDRQRIPNGKAFTASPWASGGKVFCLNEYGETFVFAAGDEFSHLHTNTLADDDMCMATPALVGDRLLIRTSARLYSIKRK
ncbi:MAG: PQQ-binding-like beta-propeller repeat protein [Planctomycetes bacterium]|nr:PQQ-binding-like beta-propeller repeat protein [Planctomycetota bacterium]